MKEYAHIETVFKRDMNAKGHPIIDGAWTLPEFEYLASNQWRWTEKVDGTNIRVIFDTDYVDYKGKTDAAQIPPFLLAKLSQLFSVGQFQEAFPMPESQMEYAITTASRVVTLYGEGYGAHIQKGGGNYIPNGVDFILFDVKVGDWWLKDEDMRNVADKLGIKAVPYIGHGTLQEAVEQVRRGFWSFLAPGMTAEGLVCRPLVDLQTRRGDRIITKIKHRDFARE